MSCFPYELTRSDLRMASHGVGKDPIRHAASYLAAGAITNATPSKIDDARGRIPQGGVLTLEVSDPSADCAITLMIWSYMQNKWILPGSNSSDHTKTFLAANNECYEYFSGQPGALYCYKASISSIDAWDNGDPVK